MTHKHPIYDDEKRLVINTITKTVSFPENNKPVLIQHDHNSEHITFECDRFVEGHDFMLCDKVEVHYNNIGARNRSVKGVYPVEDLRVADSDNSKVIFTWTPSLNATTYNGPLWFVITFSCTDNGDITYRWNTNICKDLMVSEGIDNGEAVEQNYADVLEAWRLDLFGIGDTEEASMRRVSQEQQNAIIAKGSLILDTIPDDYSDVQNEVNSVCGSIDVLKDATFTTDTFGNTEKVDLTFTDGCYLDNSGASVSLDDSNYCVTERISVTPGEVLVISGYNYAENPTYVFYDSYGKLVGRNTKYNAGSGTTTTEEVAIAPRSAATVAINGTKTLPPSLKRVTSHNEPRHKYLEKIVSNLLKNSLIVTEPVTISEITSKFLQNGVVTDLSSGNTSFVITEPIEVEEGELYKVKCGAYINCDAYVFYDKHDVMLDHHVASESYEGFEGVLLVPRNAKYLRLSTAGTLGSIAISKVVGTQEMGWSNKKWVAVGDSLTESNSRTSKNYHDYIAEKTGITVVNMGVSGSGYLRSNADNKAFYQRISSVDTDADVVTIFGSGNDLGAGAELGEVTDTGTDTLCGAINTTIDNLFSTYPLVKVGLITPTPWVSYKPGDDNAMERYANAIVKICANRGIPCLDLYHRSGLRPWEESYRNLAYSKDDGNGVHPDETGHAIIAPMINAFLKTLIF